MAEGYGRKSKRDFSQFISIALGSVNEVITYLDFIRLEYSIKLIQLI
ncbi:MAG: four helix bundle protein [Nitrososphaeria archaeon]